MIKVCDAIMGTGKSSAAINYMNAHPDKKFVYITPYLGEAERIKNNCPALKFVEPSDKIKEYDFKKTNHTAALLAQGRNITSTHQAFKNYREEMLEDVKRYGYTLIIDESVDVLELFEVHKDDVQVGIDAGLISYDNGVYSLTGKEYNGVAFRELIRRLKVSDLVSIVDTEGNKERLYYWVLPPQLIAAFEDVFVLTYLFESQSLHHFFKMYNLPFTYIGIEKNPDSGFEFSETSNYVPEYTKNIKSMIKILDKEKLNVIGDDKYALSASWFKTRASSSDLKQLKNNVYNFFNHICTRSEDRSSDLLWGGYNFSFAPIRGKGYTKSFLTFNCRATNEYKDRTNLAYIANIFVHPSEKLLYSSHGIEVDDDMYALSIMIQWIWRSAIREGSNIEIYIPSKRMRDLLIDWMDNLEKGGV